MGFKTFFTRLTEANLSGGELWKRSFRAGVLIRKIQTQEMLELGDGRILRPTKGKFNKKLVADLEAMNDEQMERLSGSKIFIEVEGTDGKEQIKVADLKKTSEFGGGGGSGAGAEATAQFESATCMISAIIQKKGNKKPEALYNEMKVWTPEQWQSEASKVSSDYSCDVEDTSMIEFVTSHSDWLKGLVYSCSFLVKQLGNGYVYLRGDSTVDMIDGNVNNMIQSTGVKRIQKEL
jgi:hypothetical protein